MSKSLDETLGQRIRLKELISEIESLEKLKCHFKYGDNRKCVLNIKTYSIFKNIFTHDVEVSAGVLQEIINGLLEDKNKQYNKLINGKR